MAAFKTSSHFVNYENGVSFFTNYFEINGSICLTLEEHQWMEERLYELYHQVIDKREELQDETL